MEDWELADKDRRLVIAAWTLAGVGCVVAIIPIFGFIAWLISAPLLLATFVLAVVLLTRGVIGQGVSLLFMSMIIAPVIIFFAPILTSVVPGLMAAHQQAQARQERQQKQHAAALAANATPKPLPLVGSMVLIQHSVRVNIPQGEVIIPAGQRVKLLKITSAALYVEYDGYSVTIPASAVNFSEE